MSELNPKTEELTQEETPVAEDFVDERVPEQPDGKADEVLDSLMADDDTIESNNDDTPAEEPPPQQQDKTEDRDALVGVLRRDNVPMAVIEATDEDTLREWANKAQKRQGDVDEYGGRLKDLEDRLGKAGDEASADDTSEEGSDAEPEATATDAVTVPEELADVIGDEAAQAVVQMIEAKYQQTAEQAQQAAAESRMVAQVMAADSVVRPQYGDKAPPTEALIAEMSRLGTEYPNTYKSVDDMLVEAYRNLAGEVPTPKRRSSQPTPSSRQPRRQPKPPADAEDVALDALMTGGTKEDARRAIQR